MGASHDPTSEDLASESDPTDDPAVERVETIPGDVAAVVSGMHANGDAPAGALSADALSDVLAAVRLNGALFFLWEVSWPYATTVPDGTTIAPVVLPGAQRIISYHVVLEGTAWAAVIGEEPIALEAGDVVLVPRGDAYVMASSRRECADAEVDAETALGFFRSMSDGELPFVVEDGGGGDVSTHVVCGFLGCDVQPFNPVLAGLPALVRLRPPPGPGEDPVHRLIDLALEESRRPRPGGHATLLRLSELMFVEVLRRCMTDEPSACTGWLAALRDPVVGRALALLHDDPAHPWTLESLAGRTGISRSRLAELFTEAVGEPPMRYLSRWRVQVATRLLRDSPAKVAVIAREVGYGSEAAFSRAFKRAMGVGPAAWRAARADRP